MKPLDNRTGKKMSYNKVIAEIKRKKTFLISTHVNADADAIASELAMMTYLKSLKKKVYIINAEKPLKMFSFFPDVNSIRIFNNQKIKYDTAIIFDCGTLSRIGCVQKLINKDKPIINIDHHVTNDFFGDINLVYSDASSTSEILFDLFKKAGFKLTRQTAQLLYLGIMTDTGSFRYDSTTSHTHEVANELLKCKISVNKMYRQSYEDIPLKDVKQFAELVDGFKMTHRNRVASLALTKNMSERFSDEFDLRDKIFTFLRAIKGIEVVVIFTESGKKLTRVNFRSQKKVDVAKLAYFFNGGGHKRASGCRIKADIKEAKRKVHKRLSKILK